MRLIISDVVVVRYVGERWFVGGVGVVTPCLSHFSTVTVLKLLKDPVLLVIIYK